MLDELISAVFVDAAYRRDFLLFISSTPLTFTVNNNTRDGYQLVPSNQHFSGFATLKLKAVLQDKNIPVGQTSTSLRQFGALPNVTLVVTIDLFVAPVATIPIINTTIVQSLPSLGTAIVVSIDTISLQDVDGSEELSVELSTDVGSDVVAVFFNSQLLWAEPPADSDSDSDTDTALRYALPVATASLVGIVNAEVTLVAVDTLFTGMFSISVTATSRELYFTNASAANATVASAVMTAEVGWAPKPSVYYARPLDIWLDAQEDAAVMVALSSLRDSWLADLAVTGAGDVELEYGPCRLAWDAAQIQAVFVDGERMEPPAFVGADFGPLAFAEDQSFALGTSDNVSVVLDQGYYGEATVALSVGAHSRTLNQAYVLTANLRVSVVPVAGTRSFSSAPNGSATIHMGFNRELAVGVSESEVSGGSSRADAEIVWFLADAAGNVDAMVVGQEPPYWPYGLSPDAGAPWRSSTVFVLEEEERRASMNSTFTVAPPRDYVGSLPLTLQSMSVTSNLIPSQLVASDAVGDASGSEHAWLTVFSTSIVESVLPTQWNHAQAPVLTVANASLRVYEDEMGVLSISELAVAALDSTAPDVHLSLDVLLPASCNVAVSVNGSTMLAIANETLDGIAYAVVQVSVDSEAVNITAGPNHCVRVEGLLRASVYAFSSSNATVIPVTLEFLTVAEQPKLSVAFVNASISEGGMFYGDIKMTPTKAELYYRIQVFYPSDYIVEVADRSWTGTVNNSQVAEDGIVSAASNSSETWSTDVEGIAVQLLSSLSTQLGYGIGVTIATSLSLVPIAKISGNLSVDVVVVAFTVDVDPDFFASDCYLGVSSSKDAFDCLPSEQWKSMTMVNQSLELSILPVAEAPRFVMSPEELSIAENGVAAVTVSNWTLGDTDGSEEMYFHLRCENNAWAEVSVDGMLVHAVSDDVDSNSSSASHSPPLEEDILTITSFALLPLAVYRPAEHGDLMVQMSPPKYFSGSVDCHLVVHAIDQSGALVSEDVYEAPLSVAVTAEATVPLVSVAATALTAVEDGVVVCDSVEASLVDVDGSEALFLVVEFGKYEQYVTSVTWRSNVSAVAFSTKADAVVPAMVYGEQPQRIVAAGAGRMEMRGSVEIGLVAGYSGELHFNVSSASVETAYLSSDDASDVAVARTAPLTIDTIVAPIANMPLVDVTVVQGGSPLGTAIVVSIDTISLQDVDGSEELSVELSTDVGSDVVAVFFNSQLLWAEPPADSDSDSDTDTALRYALPVATASLVGIVNAEVTLVAVDTLFTGMFSISVTATSRELYFTNASAANATVASAVMTAEVGWAPKPSVYYARPLDIWLDAQEDAAVMVALSSLRDSWLADLAVTGAGDVELEYGPCRLAWDAAQIQAVFVDGERMEPPAFVGADFGPLAFAEDQSFALGTSDNVSVVLDQGYYGEATVALSVGAHSRTLNQAYVLTANLRVSVVPVAGTRSFSSAPNGSATIHMGFNRELAVGVSESEVSGGSSRADAEIVWFLADAAGNVDAMVVGQEPPYWPYGLSPDAGAPWRSSTVFVLEEEERRASMNSTFTVAPPRDYVGSLPLTLQSMSVTSNLIPSQLVASDAVGDASGSEHAWLTVFSTSIVESVLPTQWNHAQAPVLTVANASLRVYEDEMGVLSISELAVAALDSTAPDVHLSLDVLLPASCNVAVSVNGSTMLAIANETLDGIAYAVVQVSVDSEAVNITAGPNHCVRVEGLLRASVYAFSSSNATVIPVTLEFLTVAEQPKLSVAFVNASISEGGMFYGDIKMTPTKAELYYRIQVFYPSDYIVEVADRSWTGTVNNSQVAEDGIVSAASNSSETWSTDVEGIAVQLLSSLSTQLGYGIGVTIATSLSLVPIAKISGNLSVDVVVVAFTVDVDPDFFASDCYLGVSSSKDAFDCLPSEQWKSMTMVNQSLELSILPVAEAPRFVMSPEELSIAENGVAAVTVSNWTLGDTDGSEEMYFHLRCENNAWAEVSVDGMLVHAVSDDVDSNSSSASHSPPLEEDILTITSFALLPLAVYRPAEHGDLMVQMSPPKYFSGSVDCHLVVHAIDQSGALVSEDVYEAPLSVAVTAEATVPLVSVAATALTAVEDGVVVCDSVEASLVDVDGSEALFLVVEFGKYEQYVTSVTWRSNVSAVAFSTKADAVVPAMVYGEQPQRIVAAGAGRMEMRGSVEIGLVAGYSGELHFNVSSASVETAYLSSDDASDVAVARTAPLTIDTIVAPIANMPLVDVTVVQGGSPLGTAIVVSIDTISLQDVDGSEELSVELSTDVGSDVVAVFFNSQLLWAEPPADSDSDSDSDSDTALRYALPVATASLVGIVNAEVTLVAVDTLFTGMFSISVTATSRELYFTNASAANATVASAVMTAEVGWAPKPSVYYARPLDIWLDAQEDAAVMVALSSLRDSWLADLAVTGAGDVELEYGPCRLAWDAAQIQAVFVDGERMEPPAFVGADFGPLAFAEDQSFALGTSDNVSVVLDQGYYGEATVALSVGAHSRTLNQAYVLTANLRVSVVPVAGTRSFSSAPNGSATIHMGFNRELAVGVSESEVSGGSSRADAEIVWFLADAAGNVDAMVVGQEPPYWPYGLSPDAGAPWRSSTVFVLEEEERRASMNSTFTVAPPRDYVGSLPLALQSMSVTSNLIPSQLVASDAVGDASGSEHAWLTVFSTSIVESVLPTQWNHAQAPVLTVANASLRVYEDEMGVLSISELAVAALDSTAPDVHLSLDVLLPASCNVAVSVNGSTMLAIANETLDGIAYAVVQVSVDSEAVNITAGPNHCVRVEGLLRASVYAFSSSNATVIPVTLEFLTVAEQPKLSVAFVNASISEGGMFYGDIKMTPTKAELYYRIQVFYPSDYIVEVADRSWTGTVNNSQVAEDGIVSAASNSSETWSTDVEGIAVQLLSSLSTQLGYGIGVTIATSLSLVPIAKISGNLSVDVVVVAFTVDVDPDFFASDCYLGVSSSKDAFDCLPSEQWKSITMVNQSLELSILPVAEAPRFVMSPEELSIAENGVAAVTVSNWTLGDTDGSEEMYFHLRCENNAWAEVSVDGMLVHAVSDDVDSNSSSASHSPPLEEDILTITSFALLPLAVYRPAEHGDLMVQMSPPKYFSGSVDCHLVVHAIDQSGALVSEDVYEAPLSVAVTAEATVPLVSVAATALTAVEDGVVVCDSVEASLVDVDGSEALFLVVEFGKYEQYVTSVTWRSNVSAVAFSTKADAVVPAMVYGEQPQRIVAAGAGRMEMRGSVEIGLVAGYSGELHFNVSSASVETAYLSSDDASDVAVARTAPLTIDTIVAPIANMPLVDVTVVQGGSPLGTAIVVSIDTISLQDVDGSEELSVELSTDVGSDVVAVFFNSQLLWAEPPADSDSDSDSDSDTALRYALPVATASLVGIVNAEVTLVAVDTLFTGMFSISVTATSRELYFTNASAANATVASAVMTAEVGWAPKPSVYYARPLDIWLDAQEDAAVMVALSSLRDSWLADLAVTGAGDVELEYGPCRLAWDAAQIQAVFVDGERMEPPAFVGADFGPLAFAEDQSFALGTSDNVSVVLDQGYYGEATVALSVGAHSRTLNQAYVLTANLRVSVVPVAGTRSFSSAPNGSATIHMGFNRELAVGVSESEVSGGSSRADAEIVWFLADAAGNVDAMVVGQEPPYWPYGLSPDAGAPWRSSTVFVLEEEERRASMNSTFTVAPPRDYVGSLPLTLQSMSVTSNLIPSQLVASDAVGDASGSEHAWLTVFSTSIVESVLPTQWNHAQAPVLTVANASLRVYEDEMGVLSISELAVAALDSTAPDVHLSLDVLLPASCNVAVSVNGSTMLAIANETLDGIAYAVVQVSVDSEAVNITAGPNHCVRVEGLLRASVYAFSSSNATVIPVTLEFLTVAEQPKLSVAFVNASISEGGMFYGDIKMTPTKAELYYRIQVFYPSDYIVEVADRSWTGTVNNSQVAEDGIVSAASNSSETWSTDVEGIAVQLLSSLSTQLGYGIGVTIATSLSLVPIAKISGNLSVDVVVVAFTVDVDPDFFASDCYLGVSSSKDAFDCLPSEQWKSMTMVNQSLELSILPVAEAPRFVMSPEELSIAENGVAAVTVSNWTLGDTDGSEEMYFHLRCENNAWAEVSVDGMLVHAVSDDVDSNSSSASHSPPLEEDILTITSFALLPLAVYRPAEHGDLMVQMSPPKYFSGSVDCHLVVHAIDQSGALVSEDVYEAPLSVAVTAEATVPLVSVAATALTAVEDGVVVCDSVEASLVDVDGSEALFLVVEFGKYEQYVTSVTWRSNVSAVAFSTKADAVVPAMVYGEQPQRIVAAGAGRMEMRGSVEIGLVAGYSGELHFNVSSASVETAYLTYGQSSSFAVARGASVQISVGIRAICHSPALRSTLTDPRFYLLKFQ
ncbi:hypothetical protein PRIC1_009855 [Phytophthora ramorum]